VLDRLFRDYPQPTWADERYKRLNFLDAALSGDLYRKLTGSFYDDSGRESYGRRSRLTNRKPSVRYNLARMVARQTARKLFSGRHAPRFEHPEEAVALAAEAIMREGLLKTRILQAAVWGSVGSVAVSFAIAPGGEDIPRIVFNVYRAKTCWPTLDSLGELKSLRLSYPVSGRSAAKLSAKDMLGKEIEDDKQYWFVRDFLPGGENTYVPVELGSKRDGVVLDEVIQTCELRPLPELSFTFEPKLVAAQWFVNLTGGDFPDGACTWDDALPGMTEIAFTLSNTGRGVRYNGTPTLAITGNLTREADKLAPGEGKVGRDAADVIRLQGEHETQGGQKHGAGRAELLEMRGNVVAATERYIQLVRKLTLEQIGASRKDPDRLHFPQSGKAMELLDEDFFDLVGELKTSYGDYGLIPLMKKALTVASARAHPLLKGVNLKNLDELSLKWPRPYQPTAQEVQLFAQALASLATPQQKKGADGTVTSSEPIIDAATARAMLDAFMDTPSRTTSIALQQQPRDQAANEPAAVKPNGSAPSDPLAMQPTGENLPPRSTGLGPPPYRQQ
jgi:hypothetical protein